MARSKKHTPTADYLAAFDGKPDKARDEVVRLTKQIGAWEDDLADYRTSIRDSINEAKAKIDGILPFTPDQ